MIWFYYVQCMYIWNYMNIYLVLELKIDYYNWNMPVVYVSYSMRASGQNRLDPQQVDLLNATIPLVPVLAVSSRYQHQNYMVLLIMLSIFIRRGHGLNCQHWFNSESSRVKGLNLVRGTWRAVWFSQKFLQGKVTYHKSPQNEVKRVHNCRERGFVRSENKGKIQVPMRFFGGRFGL